MLAKRYDHTTTEPKINLLWEKNGYFTPKIDPQKKPFTILLPPPNANDPLHIGHALYAIEDILCRYHRMLGQPTLFLPGTDHAGIETQYVFEKKLVRKGKSRFDYDRETLYQLISNYVEENRGIAKNQLKKLGFSLDWTRERFTMDPKIISIVLDTFYQLHQDGLIYRDERIVNYCPHCGTAFSELEVNHVERQDFLYYLDYGSVQIATTRPETIFADAAIAIHPQDKRFGFLKNQQATIPLLNKQIPIITDKAVEKDFGTGALKITPAHDPIDFEIGQRHDLKPTKVISLEGKMINLPSKYLDLNIDEARQMVINDLLKEEKMIKKEPLVHSVGICYRCKNTIEPMLFPQWYVKTKPLAKPAIEAVRKGQLKIFPNRFKKVYLQWLKNIHDWNISRQIVWGPRIPAWYCLDCHPEISLSFISQKGQKITGPYSRLRSKYPLGEIKKGLQSLTAPKETKYTLDPQTCPQCKGKNLLQETDTFDTWFSSGQWPLTTLGFPKGADFKYFYPTQVLDTMWDILFFWVAKMVMIGLYRTGKVPFEIAHMHCRVVDERGQKMSKSRGNVINPLNMVEKYGADALRLALVFGASPGSDIAVGDEKIRAMRNFTNKLWNINRFLHFNWPQNEKQVKRPEKLSITDQKIIDETNELITKVTDWLTGFRFDLAVDALYHFIWHRLADVYLEEIKQRLRQNDQAALYTFNLINLTCLKLLHPFAPFITEELWQNRPEKNTQALTISSWPTKIS